MKTIISFVSILLTAQFVSAQCVPVADYTFTGNTNDYSGNGYHATNFGATLTTDRFGNANSAYEFNGTSDYMDTQTSFDYQERTVSMWAMAYDTSSVRRILDQDANSLNYGTFTAVYKFGNLMGNAGGEGGNTIYNSPALNQWYHIVLVRNTNTTKIYVNGVLTHTGTPTSNGSLDYPNPQLVIGTIRTKDMNFFSGKIDDIQIYDCELTSSQVDSLFNLPNPNSSHCPPVVNYPFNGNVNDNSGNGYHATNFGATLTTDRFGNANSAYEFNGTSDYMDTQTSFDYQERTVSMWAMAYDTSSVRRILDQDASSLNYGTFTAVYKFGNLMGNAGGEGGNTIYNSPALNQWYHIVLVRNTNTTKIYVNGILTHTGTPTSNGSLDYPNPQLVIGTIRTKDMNFFSGKIDDIQIYDCELSAEQIDSLYGDYDVYLGQEINETTRFKVYPNPMSENATISIEQVVDSPYNFTLLDQQGKIVKKVTNIQDSQFTFSKESLSRGVYYIQIAFEGETPIVQKIIIE